MVDFSVAGDDYRTGAGLEDGRGGLEEEEGLCGLLVGHFGDVRHVVAPDASDGAGEVDEAGGHCCDGCDEGGRAIGVDMELWLLRVVR